MDLTGVIEMGSIFSIFLFGMIFSFRFLGFTDLTIEGSFVTGGAMFAVSNTLGFNPFISILFSIIGGCLSGLITAILHCYVGINKLLSGIISLSMLYSINMRIMGLINVDSQTSRSNIDISNSINLLNMISFSWYEPLILIALSVLIFLFFRLILSTKFGLYLRATGSNELLVTRLNKNPKTIKIIGLIISNGIIAFSGCLFSQSQGGSDINHGQGMLVSMLTALIIGESIIRPLSINRQLISGFVGAYVFGFIYTLIVVSNNIPPADFKLMIGIILIIFIYITKVTQRGKVDKSIGCDFF